MPQGTGPLVNAATIANLGEELGDPSVVAMIVGTFLDEVDDQRQAILALVNDDAPGTAEEARRAAHTLKSTTAMLGVESVTEIAKGIELALRDGNADEAARRAPDLDELLARAIPELRTFGLSVPKKALARRSCPHRRPDPAQAESSRPVQQPPPPQRR